MKIKLNTLFKNVGIITVGIAISRILGLVREIVIANKFGTSAAKDAFEVGSYIPVSISNLLVAGVFSAVFIPLFTKYIYNDKKKELREIISVLINQFTVIIGIVLIIFYFLAPYIIKIQAPFFDPYRFSIAKKIFEIAIPSIYFLSIAAMATGILNSLKMFGIPTLGGIVFNSSVVVIVLLLSRKFGIYSAALALVIGAIGQLIIQLPWIYINKLGYKLTFKLNHPAIREVYVLIIPVLLGSCINYLAPFIERFFGSGLPEGMISALSYAFKVSQFPVGLFALAISSVIFPFLSENVVCNNSKALENNLEWALKFVMIIMIPATVGLIAIASPTIRLLFQSGEFLESSTAITSTALKYYSLALIPWSFTAVLIKVFYSNKNTKTPVVVALITICILFVADAVLVKSMEYKGLALGSVIAAYINALLLLIIVRIKYKCLRISNFMKTSLSIIFSSLVMFTVIYFLLKYFEGNMNLLTKFNQLLEVAIVLIVGVITYFIFAYMTLKSDLKGIIEHENK